MKDPRTLILASSSPRRQELILTLQHPVEIYAADVDESTLFGMTPPEIVETLSLRKAQAIFDQLTDEGMEKDGIIIGSDTIVFFEGEVLGKPENKNDALRMLRKLQGNIHQVFSGVACMDSRTGKRMVSHRVTNVSMRPLSDEQINRYIATGEPMDKAGSYGIQGLGAVMVERIEGDYFNVVGLPLSLLSDMLNEFGIQII